MTPVRSASRPAQPVTEPAELRVDPRDEAVLTEVAYRMQAEWPGDIVSRRAVLTAAMVARQRADRLLDEAMYLGMYGERPPGGEDATWGKWFREVETYLREGMPDD